MKTLLTLSFLALLAASCQPRHEERLVFTPRQMTPSPVIEETYVHKYGFEVDSKEWESRGEHGQKVITLKNGVTVTENFNYGQREGETTYTFPYSSAIERVQTYKNGQLAADEIRYLGNIPKKRTEILGNGMTKVTQWYDNGSPHSVEEFKDNKLVKGEFTTLNNQPDSSVVDGNGIRTNREPSGELTSRDTLENGEMVERVSYWPNGTPKEMLPFKEGIVHGLRRTFYVGGEPDKVEQWVHGAQNGVTLIYQNGEKYAEVPYINGTKNGKEKRFRNGTELFEEISWVDGNQVGSHVSVKRSVNE